MCAYANAKGAAGEREFAKFLSDCLSRFGYTFVRYGGVERNKKSLGGDVGLDPRNPKNRIEGCILADFYLEAKAHAQPSVFAIMDKADDDARWWNRSGALVYIIKQARGSKGERIVVMRPETFKKLVVELQGYRNGEQS